VSDDRDFDPTNEDDFLGLPVDSVNEVSPGLFIGDADVDPSDRWPDGVDVLVNVAGWTNGAVKVPGGAQYLEWRVDDDPEAAPDAGALERLATLLAASITAGRTVMVYCAGGLNRSGLVVARTLIELGHGPDEAIALVRAARGRWALSNRAFVAALTVRPAGSSR
jgi:hypothetical protein